MSHPGHSAVILGAPEPPDRRSSRAGKNERRTWILSQMLCSPWSQIANFVIHTGETAWLRSKINVKTSNVCFIPPSSSGTQWVLTLLSPSTRDDTDHLLAQLQSCLLVTQKKAWQSVQKYILKQDDRGQTKNSVKKELAAVIHSFSP